MSETSKERLELKQGHKHDEDKPRWDLMPMDALDEVAKVFTGGANKYDDRNWEKGIKYGRIYAAMLRHLSQFWQGKTINKDDFNLHHLAHAVCCGLMLLHYELNDVEYVDFDDRPWNDKE